MNKLPLFTLSAALAIPSWIASAQQQRQDQPKQPNIVLFFVDDMGWADLGLGTTNLSPPT